MTLIGKAKMDFIFFIQYVMFFQSCFFIGNCDKRYYSLVIKRKKHNLTLANAYEMEEGLHKATFTASFGEKLYHFCPISTSNMIYNVEITDKGKRKTTDQKICASVADPTFVKVLNPDELKLNWDNDIELYHSGFKLDITNLSTRFKKGNKIHALFDCFKTKSNEPSAVYESWDPKQYELILGIRVYVNKIIGQTVAVEYKLVSSPVFAEDRIKISEDEYEEVASLKISPFLEYIQKKNELIESILNGSKQNTDKIRADLHDPKLQFDQFSFASAEHFQLPMWRIPIRIKPNVTPISYQKYGLWNKVDVFARIAAKHFGDFQITAGITWINEPRKAVIDDQEFNFVIADYFWKVFELRDKKSYAILVVWHSGISVAEDDTPTICQDVCAVNGWPISVSDSKLRNIYCCELTTENITKLRAPFLNLEKRAVLNLNDSKWKKIRQKMEMDNSFQKQFPKDRTV